MNEIDVMNKIKRIKEIGKSGYVTESDLESFVGQLHGSEFIFTIGWANTKRYIDAEVEFLVKGLHYIELKYREKTGNDFGGWITKSNLQSNSSTGKDEQGESRQFKRASCRK